MTRFVKHTSCIKCGSSDNYALYIDDEGNESGHCFGCQYTVPSKEYLEQNADRNQNRVKTKSKQLEEDMEVKPSNKPAITDEENKEIKSFTSLKGMVFAVFVMTFTLCLA